jgi:hypothetical protein
LFRQTTPFEKRNYLLNPTLLGGVVGLGLLAQAPRLKAAVAIAIAAKILTNFIYTLPPFFAGCIEGQLRQVDRT